MDNIDRRLVIHTEVTGTNIHKGDKINKVGLYDIDTKDYQEYDFTYENIFEHKASELVRAIFRPHATLYIGHNMEFHVDILEKHFRESNFWLTFPKPQIADTMLLSNEVTKKISLSIDELCKLFKIKQKKKQENANLEEMCKYIGEIYKKLKDKDI